MTDIMQEDPDTLRALDTSGFDSPGREMALMIQLGSVKNSASNCNRQEITRSVKCCPLFQQQLQKLRAIQQCQWLPVDAKKSERARKSYN
jgi:hypothetical protein